MLDHRPRKGNSAGAVAKGLQLAVAMGPALVDVFTARQGLVLPPKTTLGQAYAFNLSLLKAVMNGRADQLIDLAKINLWR